MKRARSFDGEAAPLASVDDRMEPPYYRLFGGIEDCVDGQHVVHLCINRQPGTYTVETLDLATMKVVTTRAESPLPKRLGMDVTLSDAYVGTGAVLNDGNMIDRTTFDVVPVPKSHHRSIVQHMLVHPTTGQCVGIVFDAVNADADDDDDDEDDDDDNADAAADKCATVCVKGGAVVYVDDTDVHMLRSPSPSRTPRRTFTFALRDGDKLLTMGIGGVVAAATVDDALVGCGPVLLPSGSRVRHKSRCLYLKHALLVVRHDGAMTLVGRAAPQWVNDMIRTLCPVAAPAGATIDGPLRVGDAGLTLEQAVANSAVALVHTDRDLHAALNAVNQLLSVMSAIEEARFRRALVKCAPKTLSDTTWGNVLLAKFFKRHVKVSEPYLLVSMIVEASSPADATDGDAIKTGRVSVLPSSGTIVIAGKTCHYTDFSLPGDVALTAAETMLVNAALSQFVRA
jgi:hypothetical protein